jgi:hypothetical protein
MNWRVVSAWSHKPEKGTDRDAACSLIVWDGQRELQSTVEFAAPSRGPDRTQAERIVQSYLASGDVPPRRMLVDRDGNVSVLESRFE